MTHDKIQTRAGGGQGDPAWPVQLLLPGQAAAPDGPVDMFMMYLMHFGFRRDLTAFAAAAAATPVADRGTWTALAKRWEVFAQMLHHHHSGEDTGLWPLLMERTDDAGREVLEAMESEHGEIDPILQACDAGFARLAAGADEDTRNALVVRLCAGKESLGRHLAHEETEAIAIIQQVMSDDDWKRLETEHFTPKMTLTLLRNAIPWLLQELPPAGQAKAFAAAAPPQRVVWWLTRGGFARRERRAFHYLA
jgi:hypothetical protein